jgi:single-strand DNA-binding protein
MADPIATPNLRSQFTGPPARKHPMATSNRKHPLAEGCGQRMVQMAERSVNKAILVGRLGSDAETRYTSSGTPVSRVSVAMNRQWTDSDEKVHEDTDWLTIVIWKKENLATYLTKGTRLYVEGRLQTRSYDDKDGVKRHVTEIIAQNIVLLGGNGNGASGRPIAEHRTGFSKPSNGQRSHEPEPEDQGVQEDLDVPF